MHLIKFLGQQMFLHSWIAKDALLELQILQIIIVEHITSEGFAEECIIKLTLSIDETTKRQSF